MNGCRAPADLTQLSLPRLFFLELINKPTSTICALHYCIVCVPLKALSQLIVPTINSSITSLECSPVFLVSLYPLSPPLAPAPGSSSGLQLQLWLWLWLQLCPPALVSGFGSGSGLWFWLQHPATASDSGSRLWLLALNVASVLAYASPHGLHNPSWSHAFPCPGNLNVCQ